MLNYSDHLMEWLVEEGYTHCFFLAGGNIMHLLNSARHRFKCVPVVNEVAAGIATEYFNALHPKDKAFALVTAGPGLTNIVTSMAGAYLESRELLVIGGQVKASDLAFPGLRQRGVQEIDGCALVQSICAATLQIRSPISRDLVLETIRLGSTQRKAPVFIEVCLDAQASTDIELSRMVLVDEIDRPPIPEHRIDAVVELIKNAKRPIFLIGGGVERDVMKKHSSDFQKIGIPIATTWNAIDRIDYRDRLNFGRPDTWGMRWSNILLQQADLIIAVGARLSLQQTGFNWEQFAPLGKVVHVDLDQAELDKPHPKKSERICGSADEFFGRFFSANARLSEWSEWIEFGSSVQAELPLDETCNQTATGFVSPYFFSEQLSDLLANDDVLIPCSSGGASTVLMQSFRQKIGQQIMNNKALASMGYGLSGAVGAAYANVGRRVILVEGDGGFAQNLQELGTVAIADLPIKIFIFANDGYASIKMTQRNYFGGAWVGCDLPTGVGLPNLQKIAEAYGIPFQELRCEKTLKDQLVDCLGQDGPMLIQIRIDPEQTYFPKISSRMTATGGMESNPLHNMSPDLPEDVLARVGKFLFEGGIL